MRHQEIPPYGATMGSPPEYVLLGDIGATNARLALLSKGLLGSIEWFTVAEFARFADAIDAFLERYCRHVSVPEALLAVAGPVAADRCVLTNCPWTIDAPELRAALGFARVHILNDFEAIARSLPQLTPGDLYPLGGGAAVPGQPMVVLGPGTGLGVACCVPAWPDAVVIASEGGHATMAPTSARENAILDRLRGEFGHVSAERVLSGPGLENLYRAVVVLDGIDAVPRDAAQITKAALDGDCAASKTALELFCGMLGTIAGNAALTFGARGGVYIAGGIAPRLTDFMARSEFRSRFERKGRLRTYLASIPTNVIVHPAATFLGLMSIAKRASRAASQETSRVG
ncbi:MAG TPA: glucokinase [Gemmatimonadales bacterium]|nr:glucokinase [Gemmatimonadales bacterium]